MGHLHKPQVQCEQIPNREPLLLLAGRGPEARDHRQQSIEKHDLEDKEPRRSGFQDGGAVSEAGRLSVWGDVSTIASQAGASPGDGSHRARDRASGVSDAQIQGGIRSAERK